MRIVSLLPSATEMLFAIGAGSEVVGVTHECDYPPEATRLPRLTSSAIAHDGTAGDIDRHVRRSLHAGSSLYFLDADLLERLQPDLIVTQELCSVCAVSYDIVARAAKRLRGDPRIVSLEPSSLEDVYATIAFLGSVTAHDEGAENLLRALRSREARLVAETLAARAKDETPRVLVLEWTDPPMSGGHWTADLIERAGGAAILAHPGANSQRLTWAQIAQSDPDVVIVAPCGFDLHATERATAELRNEPVWNGLRAYRESEVYLVDGNAYLNRPGPRLIDTAEIFATILYEDTLASPVLDPHAWQALHSERR